MDQNDTKNFKILVVEDENITAENLKLILESKGYEVLPLVTSGQKAVEVVQNVQPDLVLLDIILEDEMDGIEAARRILAIGNIPIIFLTALADRQTLERAKVAEPYGYILKPFNDHDLLNSIEMALYKHKTEQKVRREKEINSRLASLSQSLLQFLSIDEIAANILKEAQYLTGSRFGFVGYIDQKTGYLICPTMTQEIWNSCLIEDRSFVFKQFTGLWGWALSNKKSILSNNPPKDHRSSGTPPGHIAIENFLGAPAIVGDLLVGIIGVANKDEDYLEEELTVLERLATVYALAMQQYGTEEEMLKLSYAIEQSPTIFVVTDQEGIIEYVNPAFTRLTGFTRNEAVGKSPNILKSGKQPPETYKALWDTISCGNHWRGEIINRKKNGDIYWEDASISPIKNKEGFITHFLKVAEDISETKRNREALLVYKEHLEDLVKARTNALEAANTKLKEEIEERKSAKNELEQSRLRYRDIFLHSPVGIYKITPEGKILMANPALIKMLGLSSFEELKARDLEHKWFSESDSRSRFKLSMEKNGEVKGLEDRWRTSNDSFIYIRENARAAKDNDGNVLYYEGTIEDITAEKKAQENAKLQ
jgi:PAS domain S-box-containing protein